MNESIPEEILAKESWRNYFVRNQSIMTDMLMGMYKSTVRCSACSKKSITFDPFNVLSLPIPDDDCHQVSFYFFYNNFRDLTSFYEMTSTKNTMS